MKRTHTAALALATVLGLSAPAWAQPGYGCADTPYVTGSQFSEMHQIRQKHVESFRPLMQERFAKLAEMDHLAAAGVKPDDAKMEAARKDLRAIDSKLYAAEAAMLKELGDKGAPYMGRRGHRGGCGGCPGYGMGYHGFGGGYGMGWNGMAPGM